VWKYIYLLTNNPETIPLKPPVVSVFLEIGILETHRLKQNFKLSSVKPKGRNYNARKIYP